MNAKKKKLLIRVLKGLTLVTLICVLVFHQTLFGLLSGRLPWKEDAYTGKPVAELEEVLRTHGQYLQPADRNVFYFLTGRDLSPNQQLMYFVKGRRFSWFLVGTANNIGYVVVEKSNGQRIAEIVHGQSVDSL